eukprot:TRINITY_DN5595_c0_g1_i1.p3 TRINITY_DN5595_c0_g1~~TRINITY_DN5595_c0_g1_i1.p3  ORF type:complete len:105 (+),score=11.89 TRINITY_DN5595_c0_g1_i1:534-848(+)
MLDQVGAPARRRARAGAAGFAAAGDAVAAGLAMQVKIQGSAPVNHEAICSQESWALWRTLAAPPDGLEQGWEAQHCGCLVLGRLECLLSALVVLVCDVPPCRDL